MQLTVTTGGDEIYTVDASEDLELENFKALLEFESGIPSKEMTIYRDGKLLDGETKSVGSLGVRNGDVLLLVRNAPPQRQQMRQPQPRPVSGTNAPVSTTAPGLCLLGQNRPKSQKNFILLDLLDLSAQPSKDPCTIVAISEPLPCIPVSCSYCCVD